MMAIQGQRTPTSPRIGLSSQPVLTLDAIDTLAFAGLVLFMGYGLRRMAPLLGRLNIPVPVIGGLLIALVITLARARGVTLVSFDTTWQSPLMIAFFASVGFGASVSLLRTGGPLVLLFFLISTCGAVAQNLVGAGVASAIGEVPLLGILAGSVTLTGGPATGLAFAPLFEKAGVAGAETIAVAAAMAGIVSGGLLGGPLGTLLIERFRLHAMARHDRPVPQRAEHVVEAALGEPPASVPAGEDVEAFGLLKAIVLLLVALWVGSAVSGWLEQQTIPFTARAVTLPAYIGAMLVAAALRNLDDLTGWLKISQRTIDDLGSVALSIFLALALMTLRIWELAALALPLTIILLAQLVLVSVASVTVIFAVMGRDYDAAVMSSGFCGFMLGTTANAMANMTALVERYGPSPKAFLVVPMVGAFFIDFTNAVIITLFLNVWQ
jgi:ESS family glutamate:Na+ symporter